jgi:hypothetical protein
MEVASKISEAVAPWKVNFVVAFVPASPNRVVLYCVCFVKGYAKD